MSVKENKELVTRFFKEFTGGVDVTKVDAIQDKYYDPKFVYHMASGEMDYARTSRSAGNVHAFPDRTVTIEDVMAQRRQSCRPLP
jgi:hypothetical protein